MTYRGYEARVWFDRNTGVFHGEVLNGPGKITFQGRSHEELLSAFRKAVEQYLEFCEAHGEEPGSSLQPNYQARSRSAGA